MYLIVFVVMTCHSYWVDNPVRILRTRTMDDHIIKSLRAVIADGVDNVVNLASGR